MKVLKASETGTAPRNGSRFLFRAILLSGILALSTAHTGCSIFASRPVQLMSDTNAAIRAAKDVQADTLAPELYRQANEWFFRARHEYKFKNFKLATDYALKARKFAEQAEFQSLKNGGKYADVPAPEPVAPQTEPQAPGRASDSEYATPTPMPYNEENPSGGPAGTGPPPTR